MPSGAVRLPGAAAVTAAGAGVVTAEPSWMAERRRRGNPSGVGPAQRRWPWPWPWPSRMSGRRPRHWSPVRVRCPPGGRLSTGSGGRPVSTRPVSTRPARSWCPDGHASGDRGPASALSAPRWILACVGAVGPPTSGRVGCDMSRWSASGWVVAAPNWGLAGKGWSWVRLCLAPTGSTADRPPVWIRGGCGVALAAGPTWELSSAGCRSVGGGTSKSSCSHVALQVRPGPVAGVMAGWAGRC
jgi:hypothetical protein